jgi:hypothetical protein
VAHLMLSLFLQVFDDHEMFLQTLYHETYFREKVSLRGSVRDLDARGRKGGNPPDGRARIQMRSSPLSDPASETSLSLFRIPHRLAVNLVSLSLAWSDRIRIVLDTTYTYTAGKTPALYKHTLRPSSVRAGEDLVNTKITVRKFFGIFKENGSDTIFVVFEKVIIGESNQRGWCEKMRRYDRQLHTKLKSKKLDSHLKLAMTSLPGPPSAASHRRRVDHLA